MLTPFVLGGVLAVARLFAAMAWVNQGLMRVVADLRGAASQTLNPNRNPSSLDLQAWGDIRCASQSHCTQDDSVLGAGDDCWDRAGVAVGVVVWEIATKCSRQRRCWSDRLRAGVRRQWGRWRSYWQGVTTTTTSCRLCCLLQVNNTVDPIQLRVQRKRSDA